MSGDGRAWNSTLRPGNGLQRTTGLSRTGGLATSSLRRSGAHRKAPRDTGFPAAVKQAIREREGHRCAACAVPLPPGYGNVQHRLARKSGGRHGEMRAIVNSVVNGVLLCGTPFTGCHGACEDRTNTHMIAQGFRLEEGQDPAAEPVMLHGEFGGVMAWLTADGGYAFEPPRTGGEAA